MTFASAPPMTAEQYQERKDAAQRKHAEMIAEFRRQEERDKPPLAHRMGVSVSGEAVDTLFYHVIQMRRPLRSPMTRFGWDMRRHCGPAAFEDYAFWVSEFDKGTPADAERQWASFDRPREESDILLIDAIEEAESEGAILPDAETAALERLREVAEAMIKARREREEAEWQAEADAEHEAWLAEREQAETELDVIDQKRRAICMSPTSTSEDIEAADAEWEASHAEWHRRYDQLWPKRIRPETTEESDTPTGEETTAPIEQHEIDYQDFLAFSPSLSFIFIPTREMWTASGVDTRLPPVAVPGRDKPLAASRYIAHNQAVEQITWAPGQPMVIDGRLIAEGGWIHRPGARVFNRYLPPTIRRSSGDTSPWVNHVSYIFPDEAHHIVRWLAYRVQRPDIKINHALVLGGTQGVGKDTLLEPVKHAIGPWNFNEVSPQQLLGRFNGFLESVVLRVSEARDLGDTDRFAFYDHMKAYTAAPPDVLRVDEKHMRERAILNVCGVIITTNHKSDGIHLPADDRRHFVAWSPRNRDDFRPGYWPALYRWFAEGGNEIVTHHLATLDLSDFDPKAPPPKTAAFWEIVNASRTPEDAEMADALDRLQRPNAVTIQMILAVAGLDFGEWLRDRRNRRKIPHRFDECGYAPVRNPDAKDGQWKINGRRQAVYAKRELSERERENAVRAMSTAHLGR